MLSYAMLCYAMLSYAMRIFLRSQQCDWPITASLIGTCDWCVPSFPTEAAPPTPGVSLPPSLPHSTRAVPHIIRVFVSRTRALEANVYTFVGGAKRFPRLACVVARPVILGVGWQLVRLAILQKVNIVERPELAGEASSFSSESIPCMSAHGGEADRSLVFDETVKRAPLDGDPAPPPPSFVTRVASSSWS